MGLSAIYIDKNGKSEVIANPANPGSIPKDLIDVLKKYKLCDINFDKDHPGGNTAQKIDEFNKSNRDNLAEKQRLQATIDALNAKYSDAKFKITLAEDKAKCDVIYHDTIKAINEGTGKFLGIKGPDKPQARQDAKDAKDACHKAAQGKFDAAKKPIDKARSEDKDLKAAEAAQNAILIPDLPLTCEKTDACTQGCRVCVILFSNNEEIVVKQYETSKFFGENQLYFCSCTEFERDRYKIKDGKIEKVPKEK